MAKITKNDLKDIVKECLVEILAEGLVTKRQSQTSSTKKSNKLMEQVNSASRRNQKNIKSFKKPGYLNNIPSDKSHASEEKMKKISEAAMSITKDPIMSEMLADTAQTTLQEQFKAEGSKGYVPQGMGDEAQKIVENNNPEDIFGNETAGKWASLAFGA